MSKVTSENAFKSPNEIKKIDSSGSESNFTELYRQLQKHYDSSGTIKASADCSNLSIEQTLALETEEKESHPNSETRKFE